MENFNKKIETEIDSIKKMFGKDTPDQDLDYLMSKIRYISTISQLKGFREAVEIYQS
jgi:hypothetical protein